MQYDVVIVGGGMVGATLACALEGHGLSVAVVEGTAFSDRGRSDGDGRSIALSYGSRRIFEALGLWDAFAPRVEPIHRIHVSQRGRFGVTRLDRRQHNVDALGYVIGARDLGHTLQQRLGGLNDTRLLCPAQVEDLEVNAESVRLSLATPQGRTQVDASLVVAADGVESTVRERLGIEVKRRTYGQTAIIANVTPEYPHRQVAYERFTPHGPIALLPLGGEGPPRCALVWTVADDAAPRVMGYDDGQFLRALQQQFGARLGRFLHVGQRQSFPLALVRAAEHVRARVALIGNAAHTLHPVAGQGLNLGIRDVAALAELLAEAAARRQDPGAMALLNRYAQWRSRDHRRVIAFTDGLARLFTVPLAPVAWARSLGLLTVDVLPPVKRVLSRQSMGLAGRLPRLARGLALPNKGR